VSHEARQQLNIVIIGGGRLQHGQGGYPLSRQRSIGDVSRNAIGDPAQVDAATQV
jgi:hypothetical protein